MLHKFLDTDEIKDFQKTIHELETSIHVEQIKPYFFKQEKNRIHIEDHVYKDLDVFEHEEEQKEKEGKRGITSLFQQMNYTRTIFGELTLKNFLLNPTTNLKKIQQHQRILSYLSNKPCTLQYIKETLSIQNTQYFSWFLENHQEKFHLLYFHLPIVHKYINKNEEILQSSYLYNHIFSPLINVSYPFLMFLGCFLLLRSFGLSMTPSMLYTILKSCFTISILQSKSGIFAILSIFCWFVIYYYNFYIVYQHSLHCKKLVEILYNRLYILAKIVEASEKIRLLFLHRVYIGNIVFSRDVTRKYSNLIFDFDNHMFNNKGYLLKLFTQFEQDKNDFIKRIQFLGKVDAYVSILEWNTFCYTSFSNTWECKGVYHPILKKPVKNDFSFRENIILITGSNASGKSTFVRTILLNILLSQTLGIACATSFTLDRIYDYMDTYMNIPDIEGKESLFEAEMYRCKDIMKRVETYKNSFIILDEIFSSTNYKEGISASYAILEYLSRKKLHLMLTTHYYPLTQLKHKNIKCYYFSAIVNDIIKYDYKLKEGSSEQHVALDILKRNGFHQEIIDLALNIYKKIKIPQIAF